MSEKIVQLNEEVIKGQLTEGTLFIHLRSHEEMDFAYPELGDWSTVN